MASPSGRWWVVMTIFDGTFNRERTGSRSRGGKRGLLTHQKYEFRLYRTIGPAGSYERWRARSIRIGVPGMISAG